MSGFRTDPILRTKPNHRDTTPIRTNALRLRKPGNSDSPVSAPMRKENFAVARAGWGCGSFRQCHPPPAAPGRPPRAGLWVSQNWIDHRFGGYPTPTIRMRSRGPGRYAA